MLLDLDSHVRTSDGVDVGTVRRIIFDADHMRVREFVVHEGHIRPVERIVDVVDVESVDDDHTVNLKITESQVAELTPFIHADSTPVYAGYFDGGGEVKLVTRPGTVPWGAVVLTHKSQVYDKDDQHIGHLDKIVYDENARASSFTVESGHIFTHNTKIPVSAVHTVTHNRITLNISAGEAANADEA